MTRELVKSRLNSSFNRVWAGRRFAPRRTTEGNLESATANEMELPIARPIRNSIMSGYKTPVAYFNPGSISPPDHLTASLFPFFGFALPMTPPRSPGFAAGNISLFDEIW